MDSTIYQKIILPIPNKVILLTQPLVCCLSCGSVFHILARIYALENQGIYLVYSGISCPVCQSIIATVYYTVQFEPDLTPSQLMEYGDMTREIPYIILH